MKAIIVGSIGGIIGALIWGGISYAAQAEVGYVAWGVGGLVGFCVRATADELDEGFAGVIAAVIAVLSILAGKLLSAIFLANWVFQQGKVPAELGGAYWSIVQALFQASFGIVDIVFFVLAVATAYRLGSGNEDG